MDKVRSLWNEKYTCLLFIWFLSLSVFFLFILDRSVDMVSIEINFRNIFIYIDSLLQFDVNEKNILNNLVHAKWNFYTKFNSIDWMAVFFREKSLLYVKMEKRGTYLCNGWTIKRTSATWIFITMFLNKIRSKTSFDRYETGDQSFFFLWIKFFPLTSTFEFFHWNWSKLYVSTV